VGTKHWRKLLALNASNKSKAEDERRRKLHRIGGVLGGRERERKLSSHQLLSATWFYCFDAISGIVGEFFVSVIRNRWTRNQLRYGSWYFSIRCSMYAVLVILNFADKTFLRPLPSLPSASVFITLARATRSRPTKSYEVLLLFTAGACWFPSAAIDAASAAKCGGFNVSAALAEPHE
jgi:hypothetical protein